MDYKIISPRSIHRGGGDSNPACPSSGYHRSPHHARNTTAKKQRSSPLSYRRESNPGYSHLIPSQLNPSSEAMEDVRCGTEKFHRRMHLRGVEPRYSLDRSSSDEALCTPRREARPSSASLRSRSKTLQNIPIAPREWTHQVNSKSGEEQIRRSAARLLGYSRDPGPDSTLINYRFALSRSHPTAQKETMFDLSITVERLTIFLTPHRRATPHA
ncbi:hypothetical protein B0H17DRAFT_1127344 [Mycena rosella]|uniref:Uncharacterized protein n=1 Tax=Mycena rosella TaxID=1033263 RepID=A0AAD7GRP1_MYCRO|nr:hypothetical protein B0H17DRAFT_1127344 [Mycena rosella]